MPDPLPESRVTLLQASSLCPVLAGKAILAPADLSFPSGTVTWIQGPSGSGKSSLLRALARLVPYTGGLALGGAVAERIPAHDWRRRVTLLPSPPVALAPTVREDLLGSFSLKVRRGFPPAADAILRAELGRLGLAEIALNRSTTELSQGQLARVAFLRTLLAGPDVLLLDEPTANLDPETSALLAKAAVAWGRGGKVVVVAAHTPPWGGIDRVFRIAAGQLHEVSG